MTPARAKRAMLKPRGIRAICGGTAGWYYVEEDGISVVNENSPSALSFLTWKQIHQALALKRASEGKT